MTTMVPGRKPKTVLLLASIFLFVIMNSGCEAFVRKFTRKSKKPKEPEELVLVPEEYKPPSKTPEEIYRGYFLFWKSWQDELINALDNSQGNRKKRIGCAKEALKNLSYMADMLQDKARKRLDRSIRQLKELVQDMEKDVYGSNFSRYIRNAERIKLTVIRDFSYSKIKDEIK